MKNLTSVGLLACILTGCAQTNPLLDATMSWWACYTVPVVGSGQTPVTGTVQAQGKAQAQSQFGQAHNTPASAVVAIGPYSSQAQAQARIGQAHLGGYSLPVPAPLQGLAAVGDFFSRLTEANTWIRIGEFVAGALILYVGLKAIVAPAGQPVARQTFKKTLTHTAERITPAGRAERAIRHGAHPLSSSRHGRTSAAHRQVINPRTGKARVDATPKRKP